jgi:hypothetical protein
MIGVTTNLAKTRPIFLADYEIGSNNEKNHVRRPENRTSTYTCKNKRGSLSPNNVGKTNLKYRPMSL